MEPAVSVGGVLSVTWTDVPQVAALPTSSLTVTTIGVLPRPTMVPAAGLWVMCSEPGGTQLSWAVTRPVTSGTGAMQVASAKACCIGGQTTLWGASLSTTGPAQRYAAGYAPV